MADGLPENIQKGLLSSVKYLVGNFLNDKHYSKISGSLANRWDKFQSLTAAMKLMEQHGVHLTPEEEARLSGLSEGQMIDALVTKMPQQSKEQFQHFFLQLQLIVSTATRVRQALEQGRADVVEQALDDAESTGIAQYILKMAIVQAGSEVTNLKRQHGAYVRDAEAKMSRLVRGQEDAIQAKQRLAKAQGELAVFQTNQNENIKKILMSFAGGCTTALLHGVVGSWHTYVKKMKHENAIYEEYREEIEKAEQRLIDAKSDHLKGIKGVIEKKHAGLKGDLLTDTFNLWKEEIEEKKANIAAAGAIAEMEAKLKACADQQSANAKKVMARMGAASEESMRNMCFTEWKEFHQEYLKNKELEDAVKEEERRIAQFMKDHSQNAQGIMNTMSAATDTGLIQSTFAAWAEYYKEEKRIAEFAEHMNSQNSKMSQFGDKNKKSAKNAMERAHEHGLTMLYLKVWGAWRQDTRIEQLLKVHGSRIDGKRQQLLGVQQMFRNFAMQLENNIQAGADSNRDLAMGPPSSYKKKNRGMQKTEGSVSLPDIHAKPGTGRQMAAA